MQCRICNNTKNNIEYIVKEMMFGTEDKFKYFECSNCGCLQISEPLKDISKYYPKDYYSYCPVEKNINIVKKFIKFHRDDYTLNSKNLLGRIFFHYFPRADLKAIGETKIGKNAKILDVGCGYGWLLKELKKKGYKNLTGADPFIEKEIIEDDLKILAKSINELNEKFDLIMFHHSFEHFDEQKETLEKVKDLLNINGICLIRIPTVSPYAWAHYKTNWVQLDAPRHYYLHSIKSMYYLAKETGFEINKIIYDSDEFQFWGSEQYLEKINLNSENSYSKNPLTSIFNKSEIKKFKRRAKELNAKAQGDQACFLLENRELVR